MCGGLIIAALVCCPAAAARTSVTSALLGLEHSGAITSAAYASYRATYVSAQRALGRLAGTRRTELGAVLENVRAIAAAGRFTPSRLPALFLTLERNRQWWTNQQLLGNGVRVSFPGSRLVWQHYAGQGLEIQWLGTFGQANGYYLSGHENANLRHLLDEALPLAASRAGGVAWEYLFSFGGGAPPWTSGLSQGTALQVLARAWSRFKEPAYLAAARRALGVFRTPPPQGVRVLRAAGVHFAEYTYAPGDRILNGFIQALVGLYDYTAITKDAGGLALFEAGDAEARAEVPRYDTGAWSRYDQFTESTLNYHELLTEFLAHLCERTRKGAPLIPGPAPAPAPPPTPPATTAPTATAPATTTPTATAPATTTPTATAPSAKPAAASTRPAPIAADAIYCTTARRFSAYERTPPVIALLTRRVRAGTRAGVQVRLSKVSNVSMTIRQGGRVVWRTGATVEGGRPRLLWVTPNSGGTFAVTLSATDPAGNFATAQGTITVEGRA